MNRNCLSYWFPILRDGGVPVPRTELVTLDARTVGRELFAVFDGKPIGSIGQAWLDMFKSRVAEFGVPCFIRTGQTSNKHNWKNSCYVTDIERVSHHVFALIEFSDMCDMMGLPWDVWVIRELLPTKPLATLPRYGDFPLVREVRGFVENGTVLCKHPYWPTNAVADGLGWPVQDDDDIRVIGSDGRWAEPLRIISKEEIESLAENAKTFCFDDTVAIDSVLDLVADLFCGDGAWSVDVLETTRGWFVTDMAEADRSFHWPECLRLAKEAV